MTRIQLPADLFVAASHFVSKELTRYYLTGVHLDPLGYIVATNGHILFAAQAPTLPEPLTIKVNGGKPLPAKWAKGDLITIDLATNTIETDTARDVITVIDGTFPDWQRVVGTTTGDRPTDLGAPPTQYDPKLLATFATVSKILGCGRVPMVGHSNNGAPAPIRFTGRDDCYGVLVPYRGPKAPVTLPTWATKECKHNDRDNQSHHCSHGPMRQTLGSHQG